MTKIEIADCAHPKHDARCIWCAAKRHFGGGVKKIVVNRDDGFAFVSVLGIVGNVMFEEGPGGAWREARPNFSHAT
jgi:hypothetical protein